MTVLTRGAFAEPGSSLDFKTGNWRSTEKPVHFHAKAPCHAACPAGEDQQAWLAKLQEGHAEAAWAELVHANPLPAITGRVCPHPCESACNRAAIDGPLAIHNVERWLGDEAIRLGWPYPVTEPAPDAPNVAIVGAGPAGISAASARWDTARAAGTRIWRRPPSRMPFMPRVSPSMTRLWS